MGLRETFCKIFQCQDYVVLRDQVQRIEDGVAGMIPILAAVAAQFPVVATLPPDALAELNEKMDLMLRNAGTIWMDDMSVPSLPGEEFTLSVEVKLDAVQEIVAFGFGGSGNPGVIFPSGVLEFVGVEPGFATQTWGSNVAGNETSPGEVTFGGYAGAAVPINGEGIHEIARIRFRTLNVALPQSVLVSIQNYIDDIISFVPASFGAVVTFESPTT